MKNILLLIAITLVGSVFSFAQPAPTTSEGWYQLGAKQFGQKDYAGSIKSYTECVKLSPSDDKCYYGRGLGYDYSDKLELAVTDYNKTLEITPKFLGAITNLSLIYQDLKKLDLAIAIATKGIGFYPLNSELYNSRGLAFIAKVKYAEAIADLTKAIQLSGGTKNPASYHIRAKLHCLSGKIDLAEYDEKKTIDLGGTLDQKCADVISAQYVSINRTSAVYSLQNVYADLINGKYDAALAKIAKVITTYPLHEAYFKRAEIYRLYLKKPDLALIEIETLLKLNPNHEEAIQLKAELTSKSALTVNATQKPVPPTSNNYAVRSEDATGEWTGSIKVRDRNVAIQIKIESEKGLLKGHFFYNGKKSEIKSINLISDGTILIIYKEAGGIDVTLAGRIDSSLKNMEGTFALSDTSLPSGTWKATKTVSAPPAQSK